MFKIISPLFVRVAFVLSLGAFAHPAHSDESRLSLEQAVSIALASDDPSIAHYKTLAEGQSAAAIADSQLPDPKVKFGIANIATNSFAFNQEPMTQMQFGIHQSFISGTKRQLIKARGQAGSKAFRLMAQKRSLIIALEVERHWLNLKHNENVLAIIQSKKARLIELLTSLGARFESGQAAAHKVLTMEAELALLEDRIESLNQNISKGRIGLARYIGTANADKPLKGSYDDVAMPLALESLEANLPNHPDLLQEKALIQASEKSELLAKENYTPNWGLDLGYGTRAGGRPDMATAMVTLDVPLFTGKRQDKRLLAAKKSKQAARFKMRSKEMDMLRNLRASYVVYQKSSKRIDLYNTVVLQRQQSASEASELSYATGSSDFAEIIRAHLGELDARIKLEAITLERAIAQVDLNYFRGATS